jgi:MEDS: MEthanogen/methylotroph, DcmR Sensory domain
MSTAVSVNWLELDRSPHSLQFYSSDDFLLDSLARFVGTALEEGESVYAITTQAHGDGLAQRLKAWGADTAGLVRKGRYVAQDASQALGQLIVDGKPDKTHFDEFVRGVLLPLKAAAESKPQRVAVCGEVVAMLWADGKAEAAMELEQFWNELATQGCYSLRCFYPIASFSDPGQNELFMKLCAEHASVIPRESHLRNVVARVKQFESHRAAAH